MVTMLLPLYAILTISNILMKMENYNIPHTPELRNIRVRRNIDVLHSNNYEYTQGNTLKNIRDVFNKYSIIKRRKRDGNSYSQANTQVPYSYYNYNTAYKTPTINYYNVRNANIPYYDNKNPIYNNQYINKTPYGGLYNNKYTLASGLNNLNRTNTVRYSDDATTRSANFDNAESATSYNVLLNNKIETTTLKPKVVGAYIFGSAWCPQFLKKIGNLCLDVDSLDY